MKDAVEFDAPRRGPRELHEKQVRGDGKVYVGSCLEEDKKI